MLVLMTKYTVNSSIFSSTEKNDFISFTIVLTSKPVILSTAGTFFKSSWQWTQWTRAFLHCCGCAREDESSLCIYCIAGNHSLTDFYSLQIVVPGSNPSVILARALGRTVQLCMWVSCKKSYIYWNQLFLGPTNLDIFTWRKLNLGHNLSVVQNISIHLLKYVLKISWQHLFTHLSDLVNSPSRQNVKLR